MWEGELICDSELCSGSHQSIEDDSKIPHNLPESDSSSEHFTFLARNESRLDLEGTMMLPP